MFKLRFLGRTFDDLERIDRPYRLRIGNYRIVFEKDKHELLIVVVRIGHQKDIYLSTEQ